MRKEAAGFPRQVADTEFQFGARRGAALLGFGHLAAAIPAAAAELPMAAGVSAVRQARTARQRWLRSRRTGAQTSKASGTGSSSRASGTWRRSSESPRIPG